MGKGRRQSTIGGVLALGLVCWVPSADAGGFGDGPSAVNVGGMALVVPKYEGSSEYEAFAVPLIAPSSGSGLGLDGRVQFRGPDDLRFRLLDFDQFEAGPLVGWRFDREQEDAARLRGLGDVDGGVVAGAYAAYTFGPLKPFISYHHQVSGDETGGLIRFGSEATLNPTPSVSLTATLGATYADDDYMDAFFSISPQQQAASVAGLGAYDAEAGIKDVYIGLSGDVPLSDTWTVKLNGRYARLVGDAADSPIVEDENQFFAGVGLTYRFALGR